MDVTELDLESQEEEPPISSRRVVSAEPEERLAEMAFGADEPQVPIHTPPPSRARLPATAGGFETEPELAESGRLPASPPGTFEAEPDFTGVRSPTPLLPLRPQQAATRELVAEATGVARAPSDRVAEIVAEAQQFAPPTFVAAARREPRVCRACARSTRSQSQSTAAWFNQVRWRRAKTRVARTIAVSRSARAIPAGKHPARTSA